MDERFIELRDASTNDVIVFRVLGWVYHDEREFGVLHKVNHEEPAEIMERLLDGSMRYLEPEDYARVYQIFVKETETERLNEAAL
ncbi:hypothetical protein ACTHPH_21700 [Paenibacillus pasadenensis]|uniref:hypothetical protein n=1 Tax=Paenibacillus pasadenensis TaxID=217090 RepID=UPI00048CABBE|nr:hypothetical protein [Paenibacillus pasadenensis]